MGVQDVARLLGRSTGTVRAYCRGEDLPHSRDDRGRLVFDAAEVAEWRGRPEIAAMLLWGDASKYGRKAAVAGSAA